MTLDLAQFHETFFEESFEALGNMEAALLKLSAGEADAELINTIFRVAHSIKGGSATFGFTEVAAFTHSLETLLDQLRSGKRQVEPAIVDVLLRSVDVLRDMLSATQRQEPLDAGQTTILNTELKALIAGTAAASTTAGSPQAQGRAANGAAPGAPFTAAHPAAPTQAGSSHGAHGGWHIRLTPGPDMLRHGNDPLRMFGELEVIGSLTTRVNAGKLPTLVDLDPEGCLLSWDIELSTAAARSAVEQIFEWADGECELQIEPLSGAGPASPQSAEAAAVGPETVDPEAPKPIAPQPSATATGAAAKAEPPRPAAGDGGSIRVSIEKVDELLNSVGELVITQSVLSQLAAPLEGHQAEELRNALVQLERHMRSLQESVMRVRMLPIASVFNRFPRMLRDLGQRLGKKIELKMTGDQTELDKTVLEKIGDPLVHLVRNSVDHGIETPEKRLAAGKSEHGTIELNAYHKGGNVIVEVSDDGAGLNLERILAKARERGLVAADEDLSEEKIMNLIFAAGFSTAEVVSDVSGRGVGMDVVRRNINEIGGHVQVHSRPGQGSTVRIRLPLTLAILDGQLARIGEEVYVVPIVSIVETIKIKAEQISTVAQKGELFRLREEYIPIARLYELLDIRADKTELLDGLLIIVEADGRRMGLFVDELLSQQQVVIKSLETNFKQVTGLTGATMLGDGKVALILDIPGIMARFKDQDLSRDAAKEAA